MDLEVPDRQPMRRRRQTERIRTFDLPGGSHDQVFGGEPLDHGGGIHPGLLPDHIESGRLTCRGERMQDRPVGTRDTIGKIGLTMAQWKLGFETPDGVADVGHVAIVAVSGC